MEAFFGGGERVWRGLVGVVLVPAEDGEGGESGEGGGGEEPEESEPTAVHGGVGEAGEAGGSEKRTRAGGWGDWWVPWGSEAMVAAEMRVAAAAHGDQRRSQRCHSICSGFQPRARWERMAAQRWGSWWALEEVAAACRMESSGGRCMRGGTMGGERVQAATRSRDCADAEGA